MEEVAEPVVEPGQVQVQVTVVGLRHTEQQAIDTLPKGQPIGRVVRKP